MKLILNDSLVNKEFGFVSDNWNDIFCVCGDEMGKYEIEDGVIFVDTISGFS